MKKIFFVLIFFFFYSFIFADIVTPTEISPAKTSFIITHPTVGSIRNFQYLIDNDILKIQDITIYGVFYKFEKYDYSQSEKYIEENGLIHFQLVEIEDSIPPDKIRKINACSDDFYLLAKNTKGIIFIGGDDLPPATYGNQTSLLTGVEDPQRHYFELSFIYHLPGDFPAQQDSFPILKHDSTYIVWDICLGMQTMNVAMGGTLVQDIPSQLYSCKTVEDVLELDSNNVHKNYEYVLHSDLNMAGGKFHPIRFIKNSFLKTLADSLKKEIPLVYSYHHQCIDKINPDFQIIATSLDKKVPEVIHHKIFPNVYGFQFHFEFQYLYDPTIKVFIHATDQLQQSLSHYLKQKNSLVFQYSIWDYFSKIMVKYLQDLKNQ